MHGEPIVYDWKGITMKINQNEITADHFAYEGCHKIYLIENQNDFEDARSSGYGIYPIRQLEQTYEDSCDLRFISNWGLSISWPLM